MKDEIIEKLRRLLEQTITQEPLVVYLLVEVRKLMDRSANHYNTLRLCCNWAVHVELSGDAARRIVRQVDTLYPYMLKGQLTDEDKRSLRGFFVMSIFREELEDFLVHEGLRRFDDAEWNGFLASFLSVIEDCPLTCNAPGLANVDKVVLTRELGDRRTPSAGSPAIVWALFHSDQNICMLDAKLETSRKLYAQVVDNAG